jgi:phosphoribosyl 1,2-cyclic phosphodiesterase
MILQPFVMAEKGGDRVSIFYNLCSSSKGNASYLGSLTSGVLFDAGIGLRTYQKSLAAAEIDPESVQAVVISHEHSDHIQGLQSIARRYHLPVYGSRGTLSYLIEQGILSETQPLYLLDHPTEIAGMEIVPFATPHDSRESLGFRVTLPDGKVVSICTDLGVVTDTVDAAVRSSDFVMLESNYDEELLQRGRYPYFLKRRIASDHGHLSNRQSVRAIARWIQCGCCRFALAHLSQENNRPELAMGEVVDYLCAQEMLLGRDYLLDVLPPRSEGLVTEL